LSREARFSPSTVRIISPSLIVEKRRKYMLFQPTYAKSVGSAFEGANPPLPKKLFFAFSVSLHSFYLFSSLVLYGKFFLIFYFFGKKQGSFSH